MIQMALVLEALEHAQNPAFPVISGTALIF